MLISVYIVGKLASAVTNFVNDIRKGNKSSFKPNSQFFKREDGLADKNILFLGSSITYGAASHGISFVEFLNIESHMNTTKEALSGTSLAGTEKNSYVQRIKKEKLSKNKFDLLICQLSTNDGRLNKSVGEIKKEYDHNAFDVETTIGAMEYIISYAKLTWDTPILFYTCIRKADPYYEFLVYNLYKLKEKWDIEILDVWGNQWANEQIKYDNTLFADDAHPTLKGYRYIYTPLFKEKIKNILSKEI
ncbi:lysophospholipase [Staphylococcus cohnii]|nr:lysophospholipase [Staphylococcus cohnii]OAO21474.1 lysophospholipase [Staphylococcus cohnii]